MTRSEWMSVWIQKLLRWDETKKMCWDAWDRAWGKVQVFSGLVGGLIAALNYVYVECIFNLGKIRITNLITRPFSLCNLTLTKWKWGDREGGSRSSPWDMSCPRKLFLDERKSSETSACRPTSVRFLKENIYSSAFHVRHHFLFSLRTWERGKTACGHLRRQTSARTKTSARLKITFVDITYPGQRLERPSLSPYFLLL